MGSLAKASVITATTAASSADVAISTDCVVIPASQGLLSVPLKMVLKGPLARRTRSAFGYFPQ
jgi:hypothetical protein